MSEKKAQVTVLIPNPKIDELLAREAFDKGGPKMGMSEYLLTCAIEKNLGTVDERLEYLREKQKHIPATEFRRGNRKRLLSRV